MSRKLTQQEFVERSILAHNGNCDYSSSIYAGRLKEVEILCKKHEETFKQPAGEHMAGQTSCHKCILEKKMTSRLINRSRKVKVGHKLCGACSEQLPISSFRPNKDGADGLYSICDVCCSKRAKESLNDPIRCEKKRKYNQEYTRRTKDKANKKSAERRAYRSRATLPWAKYDEWESFFKEEVYNLSKLREEATNTIYHVDHIVPLKSDFVCGLHLSANLRVIPGKENLSKSNKYWPDMWEQEHGEINGN